MGAPFATRLRRAICSAGSVALLALLTACSPADEAPRDQSFAGLGQSADDYAQVERGRALQFPADHGAHDGYRIEWWYVTANLKDEQGRDWGVQWTLFRSALRPGPEQPGWNSPNAWMAHAALTSADGHVSAQRLARGGIGQAGVTAQPFAATIDDWSMRSVDGEGIDHLDMQAGDRNFRYRLRLDTDRPLVLHGDNGYSEKSGEGQASYYYSQPFYRVSGEIERDGATHQVTGTAWLDREWSSQPLSGEQEGWDWFSLQLAGGNRMMLFQVRQTQGAPYRAGTWITADGKTTALRGDQIELEPLARTRQTAHGREVPTRWRVRVPDHDVEVIAEAMQPQSWMGVSFPYWEGPVKLDGQPGGIGYLEMTGY